MSSYRFPLHYWRRGGLYVPKSLIFPYVRLGRFRLESDTPPKTCFSCWSVDHICLNRRVTYCWNCGRFGCTTRQCQYCGWYERLRDAWRAQNSSRTGMPHPDEMLSVLGGHPDDGFPREPEPTEDSQRSVTSSADMVIDKAAGTGAPVVHEPWWIKSS